MNTLKERLQSPLQKATIGAAVVAVVFFLLAVILVVAAVRTDQRRKLLARQSVWPTVAIFIGAAVFFVQSLISVAVAVYASRVSQDVDDFFSKTTRRILLATTGIDLARLFVKSAEDVGGNTENEGENAGEKETSQSDGTSFSQVKDLFRQSDVDAMKAVGNLDLHSYEDVKAWADRILPRVRDGSMPCDAPWPQEKVDLFEKWVANGMPE